MKAVILLFALIAILVAVDIPTINAEPWAKAEPEMSLEKLNEWAQKILDELKAKIRE
ncbi:U20-myrmicitoxin-Mri1a-like [Temnothorax americanus]|uniref:U20-myrmicitoxin-Mri1a-like n=1 Tax=Temnothorax americanus TaxID=1964332 RepID=UPI0040693091